jgi:hypothetical protein
VVLYQRKPAIQIVNMIQRTSLISMTAMMGIDRTKRPVTFRSCVDGRNRLMVASYPSDAGDVGRPFWPQVDLPKDRYAWTARLVVLSGTCGPGHSVRTDAR